MNQFEQASSQDSIDKNKLKKEEQSDKKNKSSINRNWIDSDSMAFRNERDTTSNKRNYDVSTSKNDEDISNLNIPLYKRLLHGKPFCSGGRCYGRFGYEYKDTKLVKKDSQTDKTVDEMVGNVTPDNIIKKRKETYLKNHPELVNIQQTEYRDFAGMEKSKLLKIINSDTYLRKLEEEFKGDKNRALIEQRSRLKQLKDVDIFVTDEIDVYVAGRYRPDSHIIIMMKKFALATSESNVLLHELEHASHNNHITKKAKKILSEATVSENKFIKNTRLYQQNKFLKVEPNYDYHSKATEILARKRVFEDDLRKLDIKKQEEPMTKEMIKKVQKIYKNNPEVLDKNSIEFLQIIKQQNILKVMKIAGYINNRNVGFVG